MDILQVRTCTLLFLMSKKFFVAPHKLLTTNAIDKLTASVYPERHKAYYRIITTSRIRLSVFSVH